MRLLITGGTIIDPLGGSDSKGDLLIEDGIIKEIFPEGEGRQKGQTRSDLRVMDAKGKVVAPGLIDMHAHLRQPGFEYKETIRTGTAAAVRGGFTSVCAMPNTNPVNDNAGITEFILTEASEKGLCRVLPIGAVTKGQRGEELAEMGMMKDAGCIAFSDDGRPIMDSSIMRRALEYSKAFDAPIISHSEDLGLSGEGVMNEGGLSSLMGLCAIPSASEEIAVFRDIALSELTGGRLHIAHVSTEGSVRIIREAKLRGIRVTAETCPHYFTLTEDAVKGYNTNAKVNPPLRTERDVMAVKEGLRDGTIDAIATDHAPHSAEDKKREFDRAPFGISGLETALSLSLRLVEEGILTLNEMIWKLTAAPALIFGLKGGSLRKGSKADVIVIDTEREYTVDSKNFHSKGKNTPFEGLGLKGVVAATITKGQLYEWP